MGNKKEKREIELNVIVKKIKNCEEFLFSGKGGNFLEINTQGLAWGKESKPKKIKKIKFSDIISIDSKKQTYSVNFIPVGSQSFFEILDNSGHKHKLKTGQWKIPNKYVKNHEYLYLVLKSYHKMAS